MKIYRGPKSKSRFDESHEHVAEVQSDALKACLQSDSYIEFNVTKGGKERQSVCNAYFDPNDVADMVSGLALRLKDKEKMLQNLCKTLQNKTMTSDQKIYDMRKYLPIYYFW